MISADPTRALAAFAVASAMASNVAVPAYRDVRATYWLDSVREAGATDADLLEAHRLGLLRLVRIDLVAAFDEARVQRSALYLGDPRCPVATFHAVEA